MTRQLPAALLLALAVAPVQAAPAPATSRPYVPVVLEKDGTANKGALDEMVTRLRAEGQTASRPIVLMVHGFDESMKRGLKDYTYLGQQLHRQGESSGLGLGVVGIHWASDAGNSAKWVLAATGHRMVSLLGFKKAVKNPYLEKCELASQVGRTGFRSVFFRLQEEFPSAPIHVVAHSMGAQVVVSALAPQAPGKSELETVEPERPVRLGMVTLAGADLDCDVFTRKENTAVRSALRHAQVWWFTVPEQGKADGVLELRRGAGKCDAVGNRGVQLTSEDLNTLLRHRALVVDQGDVPAGHGFDDYFNTRRVQALTASMLYLQDPDAAAAQGSVLASLDRVLDADSRSAARLASDENMCVRLYAAWRAHTGLRDISVVSVADEGKAIPVGMQAGR